MKVPVNSSSINNKLSLTLVLWLGLVAVTGLVGCSSSSSKDPYLTISNPSVNEGDTAPVELLFTVTLSEAVDQTVTLDYTVVDDTAVAGSDYSDTVTSGQLSIPVGGTTAEVRIYTLEDTDFEQDETFNLVVSNVQGVTLDAASYTGQGTIVNDDDAEPKGYFTGTATVNGKTYDDMTALVYENRILMFSPTANVQYDITMTAPNIYDYTGTVEVYVDGVIEQVSAVTVTGTTNELQLTGTFAGGTGFGAGSFEVAFDVNNNKAATLDRIYNHPFAYTGNVYGYDVDMGSFSVGSDGEYTGLDDTGEWCAYSYPTKSYLEIPPEAVNIYKLDHIIENYGSGTCAPPYESTGHTGFAAVLDDGGTDNKLVYAFNNDSIAIFAIMTLP